MESQNGLELCEFVNKQKLLELINSGLLKNEWTNEDKNKKHKWFNTNHYRGEIDTIQSYYNSLDDNGMVKITYRKDKNYGRYKLCNCLSSMKRIYRNYLLFDCYYDFDMVNSCATIILYLGLKHNSKNLRCLSNYVNLRNKWFSKIKKEFKCDDKQAKEIMTSLTFGANLTFKDDELNAYKNSLLFIQTELQKTREYDYIETDKKGLSWLAKLVQTIECQIVVGLINHIIQNYPELVYNKYSSTPNAIYELDGFKLSKENVDNFGGPDKVIGIIFIWLTNNQYTGISFINKSMEEKINLNEVDISTEQRSANDISTEQRSAIQQNLTASPSSVTTSFSPIVITNENKFTIPTHILELGSNDISRFVASELSKILKYSSTLEIWFSYDEDTHFWKKTKKPDAIISTFLQKAINSTRKDLIDRQTINLSTGKTSDATIEKDLKICNSWYSNATNKSRLSEIKDFLVTYINDDNFINKLDINTYELVFQNGILDLKTMTFRNGLRKEDYLTKCITFDYIKPSEADVDDVKKELLKICNNNQNHLKYYLSSIGYSLTADSDKEQIFNYFRGQSASNGKSVILEALEDIMPNYVRKAENKLFDINFDTKKELPNFYGKRIIWVNELSKMKKDADRMKSFADGTTYSFGRNYATESEKLNVIFKLFIVSNYSLNIDADNGVIRRFKLCQFNSKFDDCYEEDNYERLEFKKDKNFGFNLRNKWKLPLIQLLAEYANKYWKEKKLNEYYPNEWKEEANENMEDNNKFDGWFNDNFTIDENKLKEGEPGLYIGKQAMTDMLTNNLKNIKISDELKRMRINFTYDRNKRYNGDKGIYIGFGLKKNDDDEEEPIFEMTK